MSKQEGQLLQKDHASAFVVNHVNIFFTSTLITMQIWLSFLILCAYM